MNFHALSTCFVLVLIFIFFRISPIGSVKGVAKVKSKQPSAASSPAASVSNSGKKKKKKAKLAGF